MNPLSRITVSPFQNLLDNLFLFKTIHEKSHASSHVDLRIGERDSMTVEFRHEIADHILLGFVQVRRTRKQRSGMAIVPQSQKNQVMGITLLAKAISDTP